MKRRNLPPALCVVLYLVLLVVVYVLQRTLGVRISIFGTHIDVLPVIVAAVGVWMGSGAGFVCGFAAGLLYDISGISIEGLYPLYYLICGIICGNVGEYFRNRKVLATMLCSGGMVLMLAMLRYLFLFQFSDMGILVFARRMAVQLILAVVLSPVVLIVVRKISGNSKKGLPEQSLMEGGSNGPS